jgi:hypothetical protein
MRLYIVTADEGDTKKALAAFSTKEGATEYLSGSSRKGGVIENFETPEGAQFSTLFVYAVYKVDGKGVDQLAGYYYFKWEAEEAHGDDIKAERLEIDRMDGDDDADTPAKTPKKRVPTEAELEVAEALAHRTTPKVAPKSFASSRRRSKSLRKLVSFYVLLVVLLVVNILTHRYRQTFEYAEGVDSVEWLPEGASKISFYRDARLDVYEFDISLTGFENWADSKGYKLLEIIGEPLIITRYALYVDRPVEGVNELSEEEQFERWQELTKAYVFDGLRFSTFNEEDSIETIGGYDTEIGKAYFKARKVKNR